MILFFILIYFILESIQLNELRWNGIFIKYISILYLKYYLYNIMKIKCSFIILLMVKILKEFKNLKGFECMICGGIIGIISIYFGMLLIIVIE